MHGQAHDLELEVSLPSLNLQQPVDSKNFAEKPIHNDFYLELVKTAVKHVIVRFESFSAEDQIWNVFVDNLIIN